MSGPQEDLAVRLAKAIKQRELAKLLESALGGDIQVEGETPRLSVNESIAAEENPRGAPIGVRAKLSFIGKPENKLKYLQEKFGPHNVYNTPSGPAFRDKDGVVKLVDPVQNVFMVGTDINTDFLGDIADLAGPLVRTIPGLMVGILGARAGVSPGTITALQVPADAVGAVAAQEIGGEDLTPGERLTDTIVSAGAGALPVVAGRAFNALRTYPKRAYEKTITKTILGGDEYKKVKPVIDEGLALEQKIGGPPLSASELANTEAGHGFYNTLRRDKLAAQVIKESDLAKGESLSAFKDKTIRAIAKNPGDLKSAGTVAVQAWDANRKHHAKLLSETAGKLYDGLEQATGGQPIIPISNLTTVPGQLAYRFEGNPGMKGIISEVADNVKALVSKGGILDGEPTVRPQVFNNALSYWRERAMDKSLRPNERLAAHMTEQALRNDLDNAIGLPGLPGEVAKGLSSVRELYAQSKKAIASEENDLLEKLLVKENVGAGDTIPDMLTKRSPQEIRNTMKILSQTVPDEANLLRASAIEKLLTPSSENQVFNPGAFARAMEKTETGSKLAALMEGDPNAAALIGELKQAAKYASRISKQGTTAGGSPTAPLMWMNAISKGVPVVEGILPGIRHKLMRIPTERQLALAMNSAEGRKALLGLTRAKGSSRAAVARMAAQLSLIILNESSLADYMDEREKENER